jgi:hypothetical protein
VKSYVKLTLLTLLITACLPGSATPTPPPVCTPPPCLPGELYYCPDECPGGCGTLCATPTPAAETPAPVCTATVCQPGEVYYCPDGCPGGCGALCATPTPYAETPRPVCTPPLCQPDEVYHCPDECPGGCGTTCATPTPTVEIPPESLTFYEGCAFTVSYPQELIADGAGWFVSFNVVSAPAVSLSIQARQETGATAQAAADALVTQLTGHPGLPEYLDVTVTDFLGDSLTGAEAELGVDNEHIRFLVVVRPETLLGNLSPDDVVYEIVARAPAEAWGQWEPYFDVLFRTFQPWDCGGV